MSNLELPRLPAKITKKLKKLTLEVDLPGFDSHKLELEIDQGTVDLITLDSWLTTVFVKEAEKKAERDKWKNRLGGNGKILT